MYRPFIHVKRLGDCGTEGILNNTCYVSPKLDGTNAVLYWDTSTSTLGAGSRKRVLSLTADNADFYSWTQTDNPQVTLLRSFLQEHPNYIIYGEWGVGKIANIKDYDADAHNHLWIFDIYDEQTQAYLCPPDILALLQSAGLDTYFIPYTIFTNPTEEELLTFAQSNKFLLSQANHAGEGIVIRNPSFRDQYGHYQIAKIVLEEFKQHKRKPKPTLTPGEVETNIIDYYLTEAELSKAKAKVCLALNSDTFHLENEYIGRYLNLVFDDAILAEIPNILKRYNSPIINFKVLRQLSNIKAREYILTEKD